MQRSNMSSQKSKSIKLGAFFCAFGVCLLVASDVTVAQQLDGVQRLRSLTQQIAPKPTSAPCTTPVKTTNALKDPVSMQSGVFQSEDLQSEPGQLAFESTEPDFESAVGSFQDVPRTDDIYGTAEIYDGPAIEQSVGARPAVGQPVMVEPGIQSPAISEWTAQVEAPSWSLEHHTDQAHCSPDNVTSQDARKLWNWKDPHALWLPYYEVPLTQTLSPHSRDPSEIPFDSRGAQALPTNHGDYPATEFSAVKPSVAGHIRVNRPNVNRNSKANPDPSLNRDSYEFSSVPASDPAAESEDYRSQKLIPVRHQQHRSPFRTASSAGTTNLTASAAGPTQPQSCLLYTSPSPRDATLSRMPSSA